MCMLTVVKIYIIQCIVCIKTLRIRLHPGIGCTISVHLLLVCLIYKRHIRRKMTKFDLKGYKKR